MDVMGGHAVEPSHVWDQRTASATSCVDFQSPLLCLRLLALALDGVTEDMNELAECRALWAWASSGWCCWPSQAPTS